MRTTTTQCSAILALALGAGVAMAQDDASDAPLLAGPEVVETTGPEGGEPFDALRRARWHRGEMPLRVYGRALRVLRAAGADDEALALRPEQTEEIRGAIRDHAERMKRFIRAHKDEFRAIRERMGRDGRRGMFDRGGPRFGAGRGPRGADGAGDGGIMDGPRTDHAERSPEARRGAMRDLRALMETAPSDQAAKKRVWNALNEDQQAFVSDQIQRMRERRRQRFERMMDARTDGEPSGERGRVRRGAPERGAD